MAALRWDQVNAPSFDGAIRGLAAAQGMFSSGLGALDQTLAQRQQFATDAADRQAIADSLRYQDAAAYRDALASGRIAGNPNQLSVGVLQGLGSRVSDLQRQDAGRIANESSQYGLDRTRSIDTRMDAAAPFTSRMLEAAANNRMGDLELARNEGAEALAALPISEQIRLAQATQGSQASNLNLRTGEFNFGRDQASYADQQAAAKAVQYIAENSADEQSARAAYAQATKGLSPIAANLARSQMDPALFGYQQGGTAPATQPGASGYGFTDRDALHVAQRQAESANNPNAVSKAGARGLMQLMAPTAREWEKKLGLPAGSTDTNPEANEQVGRAYMDSLIKRYNGNQVQALAAYNWGMGNVDKWIANGQDMSKLPKETRDYIGKILPKQAGVSDPLTTAAQQDEISRRFNQNTSNSTANQVMDLAQSTETKSDVLKRLQEGPMKGVRQGELIGIMDRIMREGKLNPAQAAAVMEAGLDDQGLFARASGKIASTLTGGLIGNTSGITLNGARIDEELKRVNSTAGLQEVAANRNLASAFGQLEQSQANLDSIRSNIVRLAQREATMPTVGGAQALERAQNQFAAAYQRHQQLMGATNQADYQAQLAAREARPAQQVGGAPSSTPVPKAATTEEIQGWNNMMEKMRSGQPIPGANSGVPSWLLVK
ncbi:lytic transglycosylase [Stenotrophomonas phage C121]|uniref:endolysin n=1 Tax=Stenotrophomonas phage C121 TaxID=2914029 RepID=UPI0023291665|nr:endolysin [Stenotrophomonas phage C121]UKL14808.1 lytic transglycosylase [Stenotrophomonas phage C121]